MGQAVDNSPPDGYAFDVDGELYQVIDRREQLALLYEYTDTFGRNPNAVRLQGAMREHFESFGHRLTPGCCRAAAGGSQETIPPCP